METELFVHFAEIAGVFVGFGALIAMRGGRPSDVHDVVYLRAVLVLGVWVVVAALLPIGVNRYGVDGHPLWLACAVTALTLWAVLVVVLNVSSEARSINRTATERIDRFFPAIGLPLHLVIAGSLALVVVDRWPDVDEALYVTALIAGVVFGGYTLLVAVFSRSPDAGPGAGGD